MAINGQPTIAEAAGEFSVSTKTVRDWVAKGIIPEPPSIQYGLKEVWTFPAEYMREAKQQLNSYRKEQKRRRSQKSK